MAVQFRLPDLGEGLEEAEIVEWLVAIGDRVQREQPLVEVQTDKATVEVPSPVAGVVTKLGCEAGDRLAVGDVLVVIDDAADAPPLGDAAAAVSTSTAVPAPLTVPAEPAAASRRPEPVGAALSSPGTPVHREGRAKAAPAVRRLALELGVDLHVVPGSGPGGRVLADDVQRFASAGSPGNGAHEQAPPFPSHPFPSPPLLLGDGLRDHPFPPPAPTPGDGDAVVPAPLAPAGLGQLAPGRHPLRGIRRRTAEVMAQSWSTIPHITVMDEIDATDLLDARRGLRESDPAATASLTLTAFFVLAAARTMRRFPLANASIDPDGAGGVGEIVVHEDVHVGVAVATEQGLVVPVVAHADRRGLAGLAHEIARLTAAARDGRLAPADLAGGTCTITNYGTLGGRFATPLIKPPEAVIFGFGAVEPRPFVVDGAVVARPTLPIVLSADHRLVDGDLASALLRHLGGLLARPVRLLVEV